MVANTAAEPSPLRLDGRNLGFYGELEGPNRGRMHQLLNGQQTAGQVISTMVRLN